MLHNHSPESYLSHKSAKVSKAYQEGFKAYPMTKRTQNPYKGSYNTVRAEAWDQGWYAALCKPTILTEIGF